MATLSNAEKKFLKELTVKVNRSLNIAWLLSIINTVLFVAQAWLLALIFSTWLTNYFENLPLSNNVENYWFIVLTLCFLVRPLLNMSRELICSQASFKVRSDLRMSLLSKMEKLGPNLRHFGSDGSLSSQIIEQTDALDGFISRFTVQKKVAASTPIILLIAVAWQSKFAAILLFVTAPLVPIFMILIGHLTARKSAEQFSALAQLSGRFLDWVRGMPTLKRLQATHIAGNDLAFSSEDYRRRTMDVLKIAFLNGAVLELLAALSIALVAVYLGFGLMGILPWQKDYIPVAYFGSLFILLLAPEFYLPLRQLGADYHAKAQAEGAVQSLLPIIKAAEQLTHIESNSEITDSTSTNSNKPKSQNNAGTDLSKPFGLKLSNVSIHTAISPVLEPIADKTDDKKNAANVIQYRTRLAPISFEIPAAARIALIGSSGSGKSSLLQALMRFVDYQGEIAIVTTDPNSINNAQHINYRKLNPEKLRQHIGYLAQQVALMPLTIAENLRLANPNAKDDELQHVLQVVELWELIKRLPEGINTKLGERGQGLSGGQQQRLGIAQLLLRNDSLWLLDEPTEHLDPDTAQRIHTLLEKVSQGKTVIWITHAAEQLPWIDKIIKLFMPTLVNESTNDSNNAMTDITADDQTNEVVYDSESSSSGNLQTQSNLLGSAK